MFETTFFPLFVQLLHYTLHMPTIHRLPNCKVELRTRDHRPPHVHVLFNDGREVLVYLESLRTESRQSIRANDLADALAWIAARVDQLTERFEELQK